MSISSTATSPGGDSYPILTTTTGRNGAFTTETLPALAGGLFFDVQYGTHDVTLAVEGISATTTATASSMRPTTSCGAKHSAKRDPAWPPTAITRAKSNCAT